MDVYKIDQDDLFTHFRGYAGVLAPFAVDMDQTDENIYFLFGGRLLKFYNFLYLDNISPLKMYSISKHQLLLIL